MVELLLVIVVIATLGTIALPKFLDFRREARVAAAQSFISNIKSAVAAKKAQAAIHCNQAYNNWPRIEAIQMNDITEGGAPDAHCTTAQIPDPEQRKFLAQEIITFPTNPHNGRSDVFITGCTDICNCTDTAGYLYNPETGAIGEAHISEECIGAASESSSSEASSVSSSSSLSSTSSSVCIATSSSAGFIWDGYGCYCKDTIVDNCGVVTILELSPGGDEACTEAIGTCPFLPESIL